MYMLVTVKILLSSFLQKPFAVRFRDNFKINIGSFFYKILI